MKGQRIGYKRVSSGDQNPERQLYDVELDKIFIEYASGTTIKRPQLNLMIDYAREGDTIIVHSMDRLARNAKDLRYLIDLLVSKKISIEFKKENLIFTGNDSAMSMLLLSVISAVAEFEHALIRERQLEGVALAKKAGKFKGRKPALNDEKIEILKQCMKTRKTKGQIAKELGICRLTLYKYLKKIQQQEMANGMA